MARSPYADTNHSGSAVATTITAPIGAGSTSITLASAAGWPTANFFATLDAETASEERIWVASRSGTTLTVDARGVDGTSATSHPAGATIKHTFTATEASEANDAARYTVGAVTTKGDLLAATGANALARQAVGSNNQFLLADSSSGTGVKWGPIPSGAVSAAAMLGANVVEFAKLHASSRPRLAGRTLAAQTVTSTEATWDGALTVVPSGDFASAYVIAVCLGRAIIASASAVAALTVQISLDGGSTWTTGPELQQFIAGGLQFEGLAAGHFRTGAPSGSIQVRARVRKPTGQDPDYSNGLLLAAAVPIP